jgi:hypothetical protein
MTITGTGITLFILMAAVVAVLLWLVRTESRLKNLLAGKNGKSLEDTMTALRHDVGRVVAEQEEIKTYLRKAEGRFKRSVQGTEVVRFNAFQDVGGNQSFATAFLTEEGNGIVISSLYGRERTGIYAKPVKNYASTYELSDEEKEAIRITSMGALEFDGGKNNEKNSDKKRNGEESATPDSRGSRPY